MGLHKVISKREFDGSAYILRFERNGMIFKPGQHVIVGRVGDEDRPYSIYSGVEDDYLEILVKEVVNGNVSGKLKLVHPGELISVGSPHGSFTIGPDINHNIKYWLIATGTGISPYHSFVRSFPSLNYRIIHGIRLFKESYDNEVYGDNYYCCVTGESAGHFQGRITELLRNDAIDNSAFFYLCGNYNMIDDVYDILMEKGISEAQIKTEGYF
jgi:ferredoxin-NADP reductase